MGIVNGRDDAGEVRDEFGVVHAHTYERLHLRCGERLERFVVVPLVGAAGYPYGWTRHAVERIPGRIHVGGLRVVDVLHAVYRTRGFHAVFDALEIMQYAFCESRFHT